MLLCASSVLWLLIGISFLSISRACKAPANTNFTRPPSYWCNMDTKVSITTTCDTEVEEIITVPWATGMVIRFVPTDDKQNIEDLLAYRIVNGQRISVYSRVQSQRPPGNVVLLVRIAATPAPMTFVIKYKKTGGVQRFSQCSGMGDFEKKNSSLENSLMLSKWAIGGRSIDQVLRVNIRFVVPRDQRLRYIDSLVTVPKLFKREVENEANDTDQLVSIVYAGMTSEAIPSELFWYVRFSMAFGAQSCPLSRNCEAEELTFRENKQQGSNHKLIIGLAWGLGLGVLVISIVTWICCCKKIRDKVPEPNFNEDAPASLTHFVRDTAGDATQRKREEWTEASPKSGGKEEFYALDLSPRSKDRKGYEDF